MANGNGYGGGEYPRLVWVRAWWRFLREVLSFGGGFALMAWEALEEHNDRTYLIAGALVMMGYPFAAAVDRWLRAGPGDNSTVKQQPRQQEGPPDDPYEGPGGYYRDPGGRGRG